MGRGSARSPHRSGRGPSGAVEFDAPSVSPPGAFEQSFAWCPSELIDRGHLEANPGTLRHARTGRRGFVMITADADEFTADSCSRPPCAPEGTRPRAAAPSSSLLRTAHPTSGAASRSPSARAPGFP